MALLGLPSRVRERNTLRFLVVRREGWKGGHFPELLSARRCHCSALSYPPCCWNMIAMPQTVWRMEGWPNPSVSSLPSMIRWYHSSAAPQAPILPRAHPPHRAAIPCASLSRGCDGQHIVASAGERTSPGVRSFKHNLLVTVTRPLSIQIKKQVIR
ncbi:hypothetical protein FN846DRAFT_947846 [Sphaerosporella brunnea]|uniref:Uncharacterized protein n=1 Tax=Sphaerosporella brunnea TaxID=1250544 RepID=A0A5J5EYW0_9PEZI|nr:hypothetical protein FN846DRAFT_947846 [Sphaerosporella brunnea]